MSERHEPLQVFGYDGMTFVKCSCPLDYRPEVNVWLRDHWTGTRTEGVEAVNALIRAAKPQRTFTAEEVIEIANETSDSFGNLYRLDFIDRIRHEAAPDHPTPGVTHAAADERGAGE